MIKFLKMNFSFFVTSHKKEVFYCLTIISFGYILIIDNVVELSIIKINSNNMPRMDGTGPLGKGSMTGRGMGKCNTDNKDLESRGFGGGRGGCRRGGRGRWFDAPASPASQEDQK